MSNRADSVVYIDTGQWKMKVALGSMGIIALIILAFLFRFEAGLIVLAGGVVGAWRGLVWVSNIRRINGHNLRRMEAETRSMEIDTDIKAEQLNQEREKTDEYRISKLIVETRVGVFRFAPDLVTEPAYIPASATERKLLDTGPVIEAGPEPLDFNTTMSDPKAAYAIIGPQRVGKSYIAMHLTDYLATRGLGTNLLLGVKMEAGEWPNCNPFIGERAIGQALRAMIDTTTDRHKQKIREPRINIFLDDWINIVALVGDLAEEFFLHAATNMLSAGIVPYFLLQSDTNSDWGNKHGAQLKNNFTKLMLRATRINGIPDPAQTSGTIIFPGERTEQPVALPRGLPQLQAAAPEPPVAEPLATVAAGPGGGVVATPEPAAVADAEFVRLVRDENKSRRAAALDAYQREYAGSIVTRAKRALGEIN